ncbi:Inner membrane protein YbaN [Planctomycetaceae bacterium]|nr:Inner membrane protein YbaN [Planctomycetaceae bacterium]
MDLETDQLGDLFAPTTSRHGLIVRVALFVVGGLLVIYGILGVILPVLPGFPFLLIGMPLMAASSERARGWMNSLDRKFPLTMRLLLRRMKLERPPLNAGENERARWRRSVLMTVLIWLALAAAGSLLAVGTRLAWVQWLAPYFS